MYKCVHKRASGRQIRSLFQFKVQLNVKLVIASDFKCSATETIVGVRLTNTAMQKKNQREEKDKSVIG
jgi:predicted secreted Zn-dependent protease